MSLQGSPPGSDFIDTANTRTPYAFNKKVMQVAIIVLFLVFFFVLMLHLYARWVFQRSSRSYTISRLFTFVSPSAAASDINTGLDTLAMAQLPTFVYKENNLEAGKLDESVCMRPSLECAVCISEFQEGEKGRMLPSCKHAFHTECIDMWLFSHSTCPLCRKNVVPTMAASPNMASSTHEQQHDEEEHYLPGTTASVNQMQMEPSSSSSPLSAGARASSQITIDIPEMEGNLIVYTSGPISAKCITEQEACSSQPLQSPGLGASIKRMLSTQSRRHKSSSQEG